MHGMTWSDAAAKTPFRTAAIVVLTVVAYVPALRAGFIWNDESVGSLLGNIVFEADGLFRVWFTTESLNYWPMVWTSFWVEHQIWGFNPAGYHAVNILVHAASALLVWRLLLRLNIPGAWWAALVFAVHPVNVESVAWITQRKNTLCMLFFLAALLAYLRHDHHGRTRWYVFALALFALAMLSKGAAAGLPVVLLIMAWWRRGRIGGLDVARSLPFFAVMAAMCVVEIWFQHQRAMGGTAVSDHTFWARLAGAGWVVWFYLYKGVLPVDLCFVYLRWQFQPANWIRFLPDLCLVLLFITCLRPRRGWERPVLFALGYFVVTLGPALGFVDFFFMKYSSVADHYQYLSIVGVIALLVGASAGAAERYGRQTEFSWAAATVVAGLAMLTWNQCRIYHDEEALWLDTIRRNPAAWMAHNNLGGIRESKGNLDEAARLYREALRIKPDHANAHLNLGRIERRLGHLELAIGHFRETARITPRRAAAHRELGRALASAGRPQKAIASYRRALDLDTANPRLHLDLGVELAAAGQVDAAIGHFRTALQLDGGNSVAHYNLAVALSNDRKDGAATEAIESFRRALQIRPDYFDARFALALTLTRSGRADEALVHLTEAHRLRPRFAAPLSLKAWILATHPDSNVRDPVEAVDAGERAAALSGRKSPQALDALAAAYAAAGRFDQAVAAAREALQRIPAGADTAFGQEIRDRLEKYLRKVVHDDERLRASAGGD